MAFVAVCFNLMNYCSELQKRTSHTTRAVTGNCCCAAYKHLRFFSLSLLPLVSVPPLLQFHLTSSLPSLPWQPKIQRIFFFFAPAAPGMINRCWWPMPCTISLFGFCLSLIVGDLCLPTQWGDGYVYNLA